MTNDRWDTPQTEQKKIAQQIGDRLASDDPLGLIDPFLFADELDAELKRLADERKQNGQQ